MSQLSSCSVTLLQNERNEYQLMFQSTEPSVLNEIMSIIYERSTLSEAESEIVKKQSCNGSTRIQFRRQSKHRFLIKGPSCFYPIVSEQIAYFYAHDRQVFLKTKAGVVHRMNERIEDIEQLMEPRRFFRINRGMIVSYESVVEITALNNGKLSLRMKPDFQDEVYVSKERVVAFKKWLNT